MIYDHEIIPQASAQPNSFVGLMALYESNFLKLMELIPDIQSYKNNQIMEAAGEDNIYLSVFERTKYTISFSMTYIFESQNGNYLDPNIKVKVYFDGSLAEVLSIDEKQNKNELMKLMDQNKGIINALWKKNIILNKWLELILDKNYLVV
ncbi:MAG TPA: DUF1249 domain-containing protein [Woeseiaceae bacterium]|nr:DUF1249 domain-containing protein [Woeseiaceae bacterium]|tara:strand:- start:3986 stop:4435 length:450 start_codon:yes stop_codon:yes gene_type:complete